MSLPAASALAAAIASARSFEVEMTWPQAQSTAIALTVVRPDRVRMEIRLAGGYRGEFVLVGGEVFSKFPDVEGGAWVHDPPASVPPMVTELRPWFDGRTPYTVLPDRLDAGVPVGVYATTLSAAAPGSGSAPLAPVCTYDKATLLPRTCTAPIPAPVRAAGATSVTMTYGRWNDPRNLVEPPAPVAVAAR